jgi:hypothetical protein
MFTRFEIEVFRTQRRSTANSRSASMRADLHLNVIQPPQFDARRIAVGARGGIRAPRRPLPPAKLVGPLVPPECHGR